MKLNFIALFIVTSLSIFSAEENVSNGGYIGLDFELKASFFEAKSNYDQLSESTRIQLPVSVSAAALDHQLFSQIKLSSDILSIEKQLNSDENDMKSSEVFPYSYFSMKVGYLAKSFSSLKLNWAWEIGHQGYLISQNPALTYEAYIALYTDVKWFLNRFFLTNIDVKYQIPLYRYNLENSQIWQLTLSLQFDPSGAILNPPRDSALFTLGIRYKSVDLAYVRNKVSLSNQTMFLEPYVKFTLLY